MNTRRSASRRTRARARALVVACALAGSVVLAGCAASHPSGANQPGGPAYDPGGKITPTPTAGQKFVTLTGTLGDGVEPGCRILRTTSATYELMGDLPSLQPANQARANATLSGPVVVTGYEVTGVASHCMQGTAFVVTSITAQTGGGSTLQPPGVITPTVPTVGARLIVSGTVTDGASPGCHILQTDQGRFELLGDAKTLASLTADQKVTVTGVVVHVMSHCMQGKPLQISSIATTP